MFDLKEYVAYDCSNLVSSHSVLVWSVKTGYFFTTYGEAEGYKIAAMLD